MRRLSTTHLIVGAIIIIALAVTAGVLLRLASISATGSVILSGVPAGAHVLLDTGENVYVATSSTPVEFPDLPRGSRIVGIEQEGFWPWSKEFEVGWGDIFHFSPFLAPRDAPADIIVDPALRSAASAALQSALLPSPTAPKVSADGTVRLWLEDNVITVEWIGPEADLPEYFCIEICATRIPVLVSIVPIRSLDFYKDRSDVLILAADTGIFALETDKRGIQNFQPLYEGNLPSFAQGEGVLYVQDGDYRILTTY